MIEIPVFQNISSSFQQEITLGNRVLLITLSWNTRSEAWYMTYEDVETGVQINNIKLVENWLLLRQYKATVPNERGDFIVLRNNAESDDITYDNLGTEFILYYVSDAEGDTWVSFYGVG